MAFRVAAAPSPAPLPKAKAKKDRPYIQWLHGLPCVITGRSDVEAAHISFAAPHWGCYGRGKGTKVSDVYCLPLARAMHALQHSGRLGSEQAFWAHYGVDPHELCVVLWAIYSQYEPDVATEFAVARINQGPAGLARLKDRSTT